MISPYSAFGAPAELGAVKYAYDPRRAEQLMNEADFSKGADGFYASTRQGRFGGPIATAAGSDYETELTSMAGSWRKEGFALDQVVIPAAQASDAQLAATFPFMATRQTASNLPALAGFTTAGIPRPETRWAGPNRGGWSNSEYDRLLAVFNTTLAADERARKLSELVRIYSEDLPSISLFFPPNPVAYTSGLVGPELVPEESDVTWNVYQWELR